MEAPFDKNHEERIDSREFFNIDPAEVREVYEELRRTEEEDQLAWERQYPERL